MGRWPVSDGRILFESLMACVCVCVCVCVCDSGGDGVWLVVTCSIFGGGVCWWSCCCW